MNIRKMIVVFSAVLAMSANAASMLPASAEESISGTCGDGVTWTVADGTLTIGGTGNMDDYDNYDQEFIGMQPMETKERPWERYSDTITSVVIEEGVTGIGNFAFSGLYYVETVHWPDSLKHIGDYAFTSLNEYEVIQYEPLPAELESIGDGAFFGQQYFAEHLELPQNLKSIGMAAFVFPKRTSCGSVTIPESVETIGKYAFGGTPAPYEGDVLEWVEDLADAIAYREQPVSNFFTAMDGFIVYGNARTAAQTYAETNGFTFKALDADLVSGKCGDSMTWRYEGETSYAGTLYIEGTGDMYDYDAYDDQNEGPFFVETRQTPWEDYMGHIEKLVFSDGITSIGNFAFSPLNCLEEIVFSDSITEIGDYAFAFSSISSTEYLRISKFPANLRTIGEGAFLSCNFAGDNLILPEGLTTIGDVAFSDMISIEDADYNNWFRSQPLSAITIPDSVTSIGEHAFGATVSATVLANGEDMDYSETLTEAGASMYRKERPTASYFTDIAEFTVYANQNTAAQTYAETHDFMFHALDTDAVSGTCGNCTWKIEGDTLTISGEGALEGLSSNPLEMAEEEFPQWWTDVTNVLEESGTTLKHLVIAEGITEIGDTAFPVDTFETITLPDSLTKIGDYAFGYFLEVSGDLVLPANVTEIGDAAFVCCPYTNITILNPDAVIGECALGCSLDHRPESGAVLMEDLTITGYADSTAQLYAEEYGIPFITLDMPETTETTTTETTTTETTTTQTTTVQTTTTQTIAANKSTGSSPKTGDSGIMAFALTGLTALLGGAVCRKSN